MRRIRPCISDAIRNGHRARVIAIAPLARASRGSRAGQEGEGGDSKLFRDPQPVTIDCNPLTLFHGSVAGAALLSPARRSVRLVAVPSCRNDG